MPGTCCSVPECHLRGGHTFPSDPEVRAQWILAINRLDEETLKPWQPSKSAVVCGAHFKSEDYIQQTLFGRKPVQRKLLPSAVPSQFQWTDSLTEAQQSRDLRQPDRENMNRSYNKDMEVHVEEDFNIIVPTTMANEKNADDEIMYIDDEDEEDSVSNDTSSNNSSTKGVQTLCKNPIHDGWNSKDTNYKTFNNTPPAALKIFRAFGYRYNPDTSDKFCVSCINHAMFLPDDSVKALLNQLDESGNDCPKQTRKQSEQAQIRAQLDKLEVTEMDEEEKASQMKQLRMLAFVNPGKFMEDFDPETSTREMKKMSRRINAEKNLKKNHLYDEFGVYVSTGKDICDCLEKDCPGCHFPCPKCRSTKCGTDCRCNRRWVYDQIEIEGTGKTLTWPEAS